MGKALQKSVPKKLCERRRGKKALHKNSRQNPLRKSSRKMVSHKSARKKHCKKALGKNLCEKAHAKRHCEEANQKPSWGSTHGHLCCERVPGETAPRKRARQRAPAKKPMEIVHAKQFTEDVSKEEHVVKALPKTMQRKPCEKCYAKNFCRKEKGRNPAKELMELSVAKECKIKGSHEKACQKRPSDRAHRNRPCKERCTQEASVKKAPKIFP